MGNREYANGVAEQGTRKGNGEGVLRALSSGAAVRGQHHQGAHRRAGPSTDEAVLDVNEHLRRDLARVRARFAMDAPLAAPPGESCLKGAWMSEMPLEEAEAEFVDTVADCVGAGLSLDDALTCWESGGLAADSGDEDADAEEDGEVAALEERAPAQPSAVVPRRRGTGHRLLVR